MEKSIGSLFQEQEMFGIPVSSGTSDLLPCMFAFMSIYHLVVGLWVCGHQGRCPHIHNRVLDRCGSSSEP
ncbi:MAG: hypothetical protein ACREYF_14075, partial [Gammaproteobacteria bacterium]